MHCYGLPYADSVMLAVVSKTSDNYANLINPPFGFPGEKKSRGDYGMFNFQFILKVVKAK